MFVHDQVPPGVPAMKGKRAEISYSFEDLPAGGSVWIKTKNPDALKAIQEFLHFQIADIRPATQPRSALCDRRRRIRGPAYLPSAAAIVA